MWWDEHLWRPPIQTNKKNIMIIVNVCKPPPPPLAIAPSPLTAAGCIIFIFLNQSAGRIIFIFFKSSRGPNYIHFLKSTCGLVWADQNLIMGRIWPVGRTLDMPDIEEKESFVHVGAPNSC